MEFNKIKEWTKNKIILLAGIPILFFSFANEARTDERVKAKAALEYVIDGKHQNLGSVGVEADLIREENYEESNKALYLDANIETRILKSGMNFDIDAVRTDLEIGAKEKLDNGIIFKGFFGHERLDNIDRKGSKSGDVIGISLQKNLDLKGKFNYKLAAEKFIRTQDLDADYALKSDVDYGFFRKDNFIFSLNGILDSIIDDGFSTEYRIGPKLNFSRQKGNNVSLLAQYFNSNNPLGIDGNGYILGIEFQDGFDLDSRIFRKINGDLETAKTLNGNSNSELELDIDLARFNIRHRDYNFFLDTKHRINDEENNLGYNLITGIETPLGKEAIGFFDINHISYHNIHEKGEEESRDLIEAGIKSVFWDKGHENSGIDFDNNRILRKAEWKASLGKFRESEDGNFNLDLKGRYNFALWKGYYVPYLECELNGINNGRNEGILEAGIRTKNNFAFFTQYRDDDFLNQENLIGVRYSF